MKFQFISMIDYKLCIGWVSKIVTHQSFENPAPTPYQAWPGESRHPHPGQGWGKAGIITSYSSAGVSLGGGVNTHFQFFA